MGAGDFCTDFTCDLQYFTVGCVDKSVEAGFPVLHSHGDLSLCHALGDVEVGGYESRQLRHFVIGEVVFSDGDIEFLNFAMRCVLPCGEPHVGLLGIGAVVHHFGGGLPVDGPVEFVLHGGKKPLCGLSGHVVVDGSGIDVGDFLVELALGQADFADAGELLFKVACAEDGAVVFQPLIIHGKAFDGVGLYDIGRPFAKLHRSLGVDFIAHGNYGVEIVVFGVVDFTVCGSYSKISNN